MNNRQPVTGLQTQLEELQSQLTALRDTVERQQVRLGAQEAELTVLREGQTRKIATPIVATTSPEPALTRKPDPTRRQMLKRMGVAVLAGGAALGITAVTYAPAEAKLTVSASTSNVGAVITRNAGAITNIPSSKNFGLIASPDAILDVGSALSGPAPFTSIAISGFSSVNSQSVGVAGYSSAGYGMYGYSSSAVGVAGYSPTGYGVTGSSYSGPGVTGNSSTGFGVYGSSDSGIGIEGHSNIATQPGINAKNDDSANGIALQIEQGGFTVKGAGVGTQTAAFIHQATATNTSGHITTIDNVLCNGRQNALLFVTHNYNPVNATIFIYDAQPVGVYFNGSNWAIYHEDHSTPMALNTCFNVLIINP